MNLFWEKSSWDKEDRHLVALAQAPFQRPLAPVILSPGVTLIRGPRQIGKSTWLKLLLKTYSSQGASCFFETCEDLKDFKDLSTLLNSFPKTQFFFLDEITFVEEWWRSIKKITDSRRDVHFILTGSNSYDLKRGLDLMPGRWSETAGELSLLPMLFDEWCSMREQAHWPTLDRLSALKGFMKVGGFPAALTEAGPDLKTPTKTQKTILRWIMGDVLKLNRQEHFMKELLGQLAKTLESSVSLQTLASKTQLMSYHTAQDYLSILEHAFAIRTLYAYDPQTDQYHFKKEKKFYFTDPILYWVALNWAGIKIPENHESQLAEMIAAEWLFRKYPRIGYYSTRDGEVDFVCGRDLAIEVKWSAHTHNLSKTFKNLQVVDKKIWNQGSFFT